MDISVFSSLQAYREQVRTVACPHEECQVGVGSFCVTRVALTEGYSVEELVDWVHDDRSHQHLLTLIAKE